MLPQKGAYRWSLPQSSTNCWDCHVGLWYCLVQSCPPCIVLLVVLGHSTVSVVKQKQQTLELEQCLPIKYTGRSEYRATGVEWVEMVTNADTQVSSNLPTSLISSIWYPYLLFSAYVKLFVWIVTVMCRVDKYWEMPYHWAAFCVSQSALTTLEQREIIQVWGSLSTEPLLHLLLWRVWSNSGFLCAQITPTNRIRDYYSVNILSDRVVVLVSRWSRDLLMSLLGLVLRKLLNVWSHLILGPSCFAVMLVSAKNVSVSFLSVKVLLCMLIIHAFMT